LKHPAFKSARERPESQCPTKTIYANVLFQALEDVGRGEDLHRAEQMGALHWFKDELSEVSLVCAACQIKPAWVYREVARRLRAIQIRSKRITFIRWQLRKKRLGEIQ
jgi:hypothetical protein